MLRQYLDLDGLVYLWSKIKANFTNVIESISVNGTRQSVIDKNVNIEIPQSMPLTDVDSTPTCNSTNLVTSGGVYNFVGTQIGTKAEDTTVVHKSGTETISGNKTFSGTTTFTGITNLGSKATATTPAATDNDTSVATTAFVKTAISGKQDTLVSGTNIKTVDNCSLIGSGNIDTYRIFTLPSGTEESDNSIITAAMSDTGYVHTDSENLYIVSVFNKNIALEVPFYSNVILRPLVNGRCTNNTVTFWNEMTDNGVTMSFSVSINANTGQATYKIIQSTGIDESNLVHKTGDEDISGNKNFCGLINFNLINAGRIIVCGEDVVRTPDLATKLDKLTSSTDNAVVRFDGTTGNIQNSGVIINDSNQVTAAKFITSGGTSSQFVKGDGSLDSTAYAPKASPALTGTPTAPTAASGTKTDQIATTCFVQKAVAASAGSDVNWNNDKSCLTKTLNGTTTSIVNATTITQAGAPSIIADASCTCAQKNRRAYSARYIDSTFATIADVEEKQPMIVHFTNENDTWTADTSIADIATAAGEGRTIWGEALMFGNARMQLIMYYENFIAVFSVLSGTGMIGLTGQIQNDNDVWTYEEVNFPTEFKTINNTSITGSGDISLPTTERVDEIEETVNEIEETTAAALNELNNNKLSWSDTTNTLDQSINLPTSSAVYSAIQTAIQGIPTPMQFKGSLGTGGTYTASTLPVASSATGWTLKVITDGTYRNVAAKVGDTLISDGSTWILIPSGDEPSGTVTSVGLSMPTGFSVSGSPITSSGTLAVSMTSGYGIPTTIQMTNWSNKQDAISDLQTIRSNACTGASKVSNVQSDWNATSGLAQILNKPTVISSIGYSAPTGYITANNSNAIQLTMCTSSGRKLNIGGSSWQVTSTTEPSSSTDKDLVAPTWSAMASALSGKANSATTLSGYGITDAKIQNGTITLGSNSITPLTSHQTLKTINNASLVGSGNITITGVCGGSGVNTAPSGGTGSQITIGGTAHYFVSTKSYCSSSDANVAPSWSAMATCLAAVRSEISGSAVTIYTGTSAPTSSTGVNGDIYIQTSGCA